MVRIICRMHAGIPSLLILLLLSLLVSCSDGSVHNGQFGFPPTPEGTFCDPDGVEAYLTWVADTFPEITRLRRIGFSGEGRSIYGLEISDKPGMVEAEPAVLINGAIHGNEQLSAGVAMKLADYLINLEATDPDYSLIAEMKLHIIPVVNPDGLAEGSRFNANGIDLNRNFGYNWYEKAPYNGESPFDQKESAAIRADSLRYGYTLSINLHTASSNGNPDSSDGIGIYAPWDAIRTDTAGDETSFTEFYLPNYPLIKEIGLAYEGAVTSQNRYPYDDYFRYGEGADWYIMYGSMADWALGEGGCVSYTIELYGLQNYTTDDAILLKDVWEVHRPAIIQLIGQASRGSGGRVVDAQGNGICEAVVSLACTASPGSRSFVPQIYDVLTGKTDAQGYFRLLTDPGTYTITISKEGYETFESAITVDDTTGVGRTDGGSGYEGYPEYRLETMLF